MYRGSLAGVLVERVLCANPAIILSQKSQKYDYIHLVNVFRRHFMQKVALLGGCSNRVFWESAAKNRVFRLKSGGHLLLFPLL